ncbi:MAG: hypothetical protein VB875_06275 [Pirellulales bacterium]
MKTNRGNLLVILTLLTLFAVWCVSKLCNQRRAWFVVGMVGIAGTVLAVGWLARRGFRSLKSSARGLYLMLLLAMLRRQISH